MLLQCVGIGVHDDLLQGVAVSHIVWQYVAMCDSKLQCVAVGCSVCLLRPSNAHFLLSAILCVVGVLQRRTFLLQLFV